MQGTIGSKTSPIEPLDDWDSDSDRSQPSDHPAIERVCKMGFGILVTGICLQALAAAIALAVAIAVVVSAVTGSRLWAVITAVVIVGGFCATATVCRIRARRAGTRS